MGRAWATAPSFDGVLPQEPVGASNPEAPAQAKPALMPGEPTGCGLTPTVVPDFELEDVNPNSPSYGASYNRDGQLGQVMVIYWANAS